MVDPASLDIPEEIETPRLVLRCPREGDGAIVHASVVESLADLRRYAASLPWSLAEPWNVPRCEIGWWGRSSLLGRGLMTEATAALLEFAFARLLMKRVAALTEAGNPRSCALCERIGLELEGTLRNSRRSPEGELLDVRLYAAVRP